jgi:hypothetical protein
LLWVVPPLEPVPISVFVFLGTVAGFIEVHIGMGTESDDHMTTSLLIDNLEFDGDNYSLPQLYLYSESLCQL